MAKIICFEGVHGCGKGTLIDCLLKEFENNYSGKYAIIRDSEYPEFEIVKQDIRAGRYPDAKDIISVVARTRARIYTDYINERLMDLDVAILDRSYYTSAVWQSDSYSAVYDIIRDNENRGIPRADMTFVLFAPIEVIMNRLISRGRPDLCEHNLATISANQEKYLDIAKNCAECVALCTNDDPFRLAKAVYSLISANNAL